MNDVILWGSGNCGKKVISYKMILSDYKMADIIISIQTEDNEEIRKQLKAWGITNNVFTLNEALLTENVKKRRSECMEFHNEHMDSYFESAEFDDSMSVFWDDQTVFKTLFDKLDKEKIVELACGRGRHVSKYLSEAKEIVLVDILERNIQYCKERFLKEKKIQYYVNSGNELTALKSDYYSSIFSYDSMVHFESIDIYHYLLETKRILMSGGMALFHHSNNCKDYRDSFMTGVNGRNYMSIDLFAHFADRAGLEVVEQHIYPWENVEDGITLLRKR